MQVVPQSKSPLRNRIILTGLLTLFTLVLYSTSTTEKYEWQLHNLLHRMLAEPVAEQIAIVEIDNESLQQHGRWPWSRTLQAEVVDTIADARTLGLGIYILYTEPATTSADKDGDHKLAQAISRHGRVILPIALEQDVQGKVQEVLPIPQISQAAWGLGHATINLDSDKCCPRELYLYAGINQPRWPALPSALINQNPPPGWVSPQHLISQPANQINRIGSWSQYFPIHPRFTADPDSITRISAHRLLSGDNAAIDALNGKYVLLGVTAQGVGERLITPTAHGYTRLSMVENGALMLNALLLKEWAIKAPKALAICILAIISLFGSWMILGATRFQIMSTTLALAGLILVWFIALNGYMLWFPVGPVIVALGISLLASRWYQLRHLNQYAFQDFLTGLLNRRSFDIALRQKWKASQRNDVALTLILIDADYFKNYNDSYGHMAGDHVLSRLGGAIKSVARKRKDHAARIGGEEFALLLSDTEGAVAKRVAERVRITVESLSIPHNNSDVSSVVTISLGLARLVPDERTSHKMLFEMADRALYEAKRQGRNRTHCDIQIPLPDLSPELS